ncbi:MAG TPA: hypothetical protein VIM11_00205 [Tepidisphaeraceae bacterium]
MKTKIRCGTRVSPLDEIRVFGALSYIYARRGDGPVHYNLGSTDSLSSASTPNTHS